MLRTGTLGANCCLGRLREKYSGGWEHYRHSRAHSHSLSVTIGGGGKRATGGSVCACVSTRPAVTAPSSRARGLPAPGRCVGSRRPATPWASPAGEGPPARPGSRAPVSNLPRGAGKSARQRKKGASPRPRGSVRRRGGQGGRGGRGRPAVAAPRRVPAARGAPSPAPPVKLFLLGSPHPKSAARAGEAGEAGRRAGFAAAAAAAGEEEVVPAGARPGRGNARPARPPPAPVARLAPGPRPAATLAGRARRGSGGGGSSRCGPAARRSQQCGAGKTKGFHFACVPVSHLRSRGAARDPLPAGAAPPGARSRARPVFPADPPLPSPAPQAPGPTRSDSWSRGIRPYCPRGAARRALGLGRWRPPRARAPTGLGEREPGTPRKPSPRRRRRRCPPDAAALGVSFFFFFCQS